VLHLEGLGRVDVTGAIALRNMLREARNSNVEVELRDVPPHARRFVTEVVEAEKDPLGGGH
jgi:ABC-type transporter Mla MlaB component